MERRLAAIFAADVVGYSRLMEQDEVGTLAALKTHRAGLIDPLIAEHNGRVVKLMGDGALVEFASVVDAVECALAIQSGMMERNAEATEERRMHFRIGVHLGDVIVDGEDIYGDGVNVAARLEGLSEPGAICISQQAFDQVETKLDLSYESLGEQQFKNITRPIRAYRILLDEKGSQKRLTRARRGLSTAQWIGSIAGVVLIVAGIVVTWWQPWKPDVEPASLERMAFPLPDRPSIAVLPFDNISGDPKQEYFANGMTEDLITDLSKISGLFVIARNSSFAYKGQQVKVRQVAEELGVRYVLEGSVRRVGNQVRINAQLVDATTGGHIWAERWDGVMSDVFALQDNITREIVTALAISLTPNEQGRPRSGETNDIAAYDAFLQGWEHLQRHTAKEFARARPFLEGAIERDPSYGRAYAALAWLYYQAVQRNWHRMLGVDSKIEAYALVDEFLEKAMRHPSALAHRVAADKLWQAEQQFEKAVSEARLGVELDPNNPVILVGLARALTHSGGPEEAVAAMKSSMRLDPNYPPYDLFVLGLALFTTGRFDEAAAAFQRALERNPEFVFPEAPLAAAFAHLGEPAQATAARDRFTQAVGRTSVSTIMSYYPFKRMEDEERLRRGLQKAGFVTQPFLADQPFSTPVSVEVLSESELRAKIVGNTLTGKSDSGSQWTEYYLRDGGLKGIEDGEAYVAAWTISGPVMCLDFDNDDDDICVTTALNGSKVRFFGLDGKPAPGYATGTLLEGDQTGF